MTDKEGHVIGDILVAQLVLTILAFIQIAESYRPTCAICDCTANSITCFNQNLTNVPLRNDTWLRQRRKPFLAGLQKFDLTRNQIRQLSADDFQYTPYLRTLILRHNKLQDISQAAFKGLRHLEILDVSHNHLLKFAPDSLSVPMGMRVLDLTANQINGSNALGLSSMRQLKELNLSENPWSETALETITLPPNIEILRLSGASLTHIPDSLFNNSWNLRILDISRNNLTTLSFFILERLRLVTKINLAGNTWACTCEIQALKSWLTFHPYETYENDTVPICDAPMSLAGQSLLDVRYAQLVCPPVPKQCPFPFWPTPRPFIPKYNYMTGVNIAGSLLGMVLVFLLCFAYDRGKKKMFEKQKAERRRARSAHHHRHHHNHADLSDPAHTVSFMLAEREEAETSGRHASGR